MPDRTWLHDSVMYQIYPRSFFDASGDGTGDLKGITAKLDYLKWDLGVDVLWLSPFYPSPMADLGYDIKDYCAVDSLFGTLDDFRELLAETHRRGMRLLVDLVPNHTSTEHPWFIESKSARDSDKRGWYVWRDPSPAGGPPNNWQSVFGGSAWQFDEASGQYYLHSFLPQQADLNWDNAMVRRAMHDVMRFWLDLGVDGFRVDVASYLSKDPYFRDDPQDPESPDGQGLLPYYSQHGPHLFLYLEGMATVLAHYPERFMVLEAHPDDPADSAEYYTQFYEHVDPAVCAPFNFRAILTPWSARQFGDFIRQFEADMHPDYVPVYCFGNHDERRLATRVGRAASKTAAVLLLTLPGMPVVYYGDELGMHNASVDDGALAADHPLADAVRYAARTPMQWSADPQAGFTAGDTPWLPVNTDYPTRNVGAELTDPDSHLSLYRDLLSLRRESEALRYGAYRPVEPENANVLSFVRAVRDEALAVLLNFSGEPQAVEIRGLRGEAVLSTYHRTGEVENQLQLEPHEGLVVRLAASSPLARE